MSGKATSSRTPVQKQGTQESLSIDTIGQCMDRIYHQTIHSALRILEETVHGGMKVERSDVIVGGSWGTTVAMAYAPDYSQSLRSVILRGVCAMRRQEIDWLFADRPNEEPPHETTTTTSRS